MTHRARTLLTGLLALVLAAGAAQGAITRTFSFTSAAPTDDVRLDERAGSSNYGGANDLSIRVSSNKLQYESNYPGFHYNRIPVLQFDLGTNPDWNIISVDTCTFSWVGQHFEQRSFRFYRLTETFDEMTATWVTRPDRDTSAWVDVTPPQQSWSRYSVDLSSLLLNNGNSPTFGIQYELAGASIVAWDTEHSYSKESSSWSWPRLTAEFTAEFTGDPSSIPEPTTLSLVGLGLVGLVRRLRRRA